MTNSTTSTTNKHGQKRVVVTGMGWITPLGHDIDSVWRRLLNSESGMGPTTRFDARTFPTNFSAEVRDYTIARFVKDAKVHASAGLNSQFALGAACQAWKQSGLGDFAGLNKKRVGLYLGAGEGVLDFDQYAASNLAGWNAELKKVDGVRWADTAHKVLEKMCEVEQEPNMPLAHLAREFGIRGPALNCLTACAASTQAIGEAYSLIQRGDADVMISGGTHTMIHVLGVTGFNRLTALSTSKGDPTKASRPFDATRDGFVMGEGSGMIVIESLEHALARGAKPLAEVAGYGSSADAFRITDIHPEGRGGAASMGVALAQAGIDPAARRADGRAAIDYISAHGTGTKENDSIETRGVKRVFGDNAKDIPMSSIKSMMGHLIAAAGAVEFITCVLAIRDGMLPPTINYGTPDPALDLDYAVSYTHLTLPTSP
jgi:3-oxoacyl-[acyl-carrier-protein] synthase II